MNAYMFHGGRTPSVTKNPLHDTDEYKALKKASDYLDKCEERYAETKRLLEFLGGLVVEAKDKVNKANEEYLKVEEKYYQGK